MAFLSFAQRQILHIRQGGRAVLLRKIRRAAWIVFGPVFYLFALPAVVIIRASRPWFLVRLGRLLGSRIGHFAADTELYLCERDAGINVPEERHVDLFYVRAPVCNRQLAAMWKRKLPVWPRLILEPIRVVNRWFPGYMDHELELTTQFDRDVHNLLDRFPPHLSFTPKEELRGQEGMRSMGMDPDSRFVCLIVRDGAFLNSFMPGEWDYHNYRDSDIQNYVLAVEELASRGYFVIRMGAAVRERLQSTHPQVIDYATNGARSDFMDIYLGSKCTFCISAATGFDAIPQVFRRPIVFVNHVPLGYLATSRRQFLGITKHHRSANDGRELALREIFESGAAFFAFAEEYEAHGIFLTENSPEEIRDAVAEMAERVTETWRQQEEDAELQHRFWEIFPTHSVDSERKRPLHGEIRSRFGACFLRDNRWWLE